jgi:hypothetical protein
MAENLHTSEVMETKVCVKCQQEKQLSDFYFRKETGKYRPDCRACLTARNTKWRKANWDSFKETARKRIERNRDKISAQRKLYDEKNKEKLQAYHKEYHQKNREKALIDRKEWYQKQDREEQLQQRREWYQNNKEKHAANREKYEQENKDRLRAARRKWENNRLKTDLNYCLQKTLRGRIRASLKGLTKKQERTEELIGCTIEEFRAYIESQFKEGMTWENWSAYGWHIDHRIPLTWFNLENENCRKLAFHYKNMQPLWWDQNIKKNNRYADPILH